jgi:acyl carrier protein
MATRKGRRAAHGKTPRTPARIRRIVAGVINVAASRIDDEDDFIRDLGTDSLRVLEIMVALEQEFQVTFVEAELRHFTCIKDLTALLASKP